MKTWLQLYLHSIIEQLQMQSIFVNTEQDTENKRHGVQEVVLTYEMQK